MNDTWPSNALYWRNSPVENPVIVLFSGGRDSTLAAVRTILRGEVPILCLFDSGLGVQRGLVSKRLQELRTSVGAHRFEVAKIPVFGLVRTIALLPLVDDILHDQVNLIPLAESLAMHAAAVVLAKKVNAERIVNGFSGYQSHLPEQGPDAVQRIADFIAEYDIQLDTPLRNVKSVQEVQYELLEYGLSPKSLEGVSVFADCCQPASVDTVAQYIERKLPALRTFVGRLTN